ncbi:hypothetical protein Taro_015884 [Colocasia esculenta]|uniref:T-complex protein 11 n=1 Tax=Colocasia esculenta TaxID=4460 RepID=A0A843UIT9_COLES|nr:hypothetical protein [Colocasia esculenta]
MDAAAAPGMEEWPGKERPAAIAMEFPAGDPSTPSGSPPCKVPRRLRRRLADSRSAPASLEGIEARLREADHRRQQFHEWLSSKARPKPRSPSWSSQEEDLGQRLEAKLNAAEQKRLSLLQRAQMRLARLDELRQAAKTGVVLRVEKEREELGTKVTSRIQQAEANRMLLLQAHMQRRAAVQERTAQSLLKRINRENKYKECVRTAIYQKRAAAEKKRLGLLEAEKTRAHAKVMRARRVANSVCHQREIERRRMKERLEDRLQRAKRQRAEYLRQRGSPHCSGHVTLNKMRKHGDFLSRKLACCWRQFVRSKKTTFALAKAYEPLGLNADNIKDMPFEQLARRIESATTLETVKALLDRLESRFIFALSSTQSGPENIDHLLKRVATPNRRMTPNKTTRARGQMKKGYSNEPHKRSRYPVRIVLCAYMILGHPDAVFSMRGEREIALADSAVSFIREFELLISIILNGGANNVTLSRPSSVHVTSQSWGHHQDSPTRLLGRQTFRSQLAAFDAAWRSYLYCFVVWKVKDARLLEEDLVRAACQLELSMLQKCKLSPEGKSPHLSHDMRAIQKQVTEDQQLLRQKIQHLSGNAGIERMESALANMRSKYFEAKESGSPSVTPIALISSSSQMSTQTSKEQCHIERNGMSRSVVRSLFKDENSSPSSNSLSTPSQDPQILMPMGKQSMENEVIVNEILHQNGRSIIDDFNINSKEEMDIKAKIKETMEKAFWDEVLESSSKEQPDYGRVIGLVKEVRDELCGLAPKSWKAEILDNIDLDILSQVLESRAKDLSYLGRVLEYALGRLIKLSAPANEEQMKKAHEKFLTELADLGARSDDELNSSFVITVVSGLRFVLEQIQALKQEISRARIQMMEPIIRSPAGVEYLQKAFTNRYGPSSDAANALPLTKQWISSTQESLHEWEEHTDSLSILPTSQGLPPVTLLRSGGRSIPTASSSSKSRSELASFTSSGGALSECKGDKVDILVRLGLLKLVSRIEGLTQEALPETLKLNFLRLRNVQGQLQKIIVICTSMLVLRQTLVSQNSASPAAVVENMISLAVRRLTELIEGQPDVGIDEIVEALAGSSPENNGLRVGKEVMARVLSKSLQAGDAVFVRVSRAVYLAVRGLVLGGNGTAGRQMAGMALQRVGGTALLDQVVEAAEPLLMTAVVSGQVHGAWYGCLVRP